MIAPQNGNKNVGRFLRKLGAGAAAASRLGTAVGIASKQGHTEKQQTDQVRLAVRVLRKERHGREAASLQQVPEFLLLLRGVPEARLEAAQADVPTGRPSQSRLQFIERSATTTGRV